MNEKKLIQKFLCVLLTAFLFFQFMPLQAAAEETHYYENGFCTFSECEAPYEAATQNENGVYEIDNAGKLFWFAALVNDEHQSTSNALVTEDITVPAGYDWIPIGTSSYRGTFDGGNHQISGLYCSGDYAYVGMFGLLEKATVKNINLTDSTFITTNTLYGYAGGIAGRSSHINSDGSTISDCSVSHTTVRGDYAGGITAVIEHSSEVIDCDTANDGNYFTAVKYGGGIAGECRSGSTIQNCRAGGVVTGEYAGGAAAYVWNDAGPYESRRNNITLTSSIATVGGTNTQYAGGIVGYVSGRSRMSMNNCCVKASISTKHASDAYAGGLLGYSNAGRDGRVYIENSFTYDITLNGFINASIASGGYVEVTNCYSNNNQSGVPLVVSCYTEKTEFKTDAQFSSGEVAYLLDQQSTHVWGQNIDNGNLNYGFPAFGFAKVYKGYENCLSTEEKYSNTELSSAPAHTPGDWSDNDDGTTHSQLCSLCETPLTTEAHTPEDDDNTCLTEVTCSKCSHITTPARTAHDFSEEVDGTRVDATCMETGSVTMKCAYCSITNLETLEIDKENHTGNVTAGVNASSGNCGENGYSGDTVCECGATIVTGSVIPASGEHSDKDGDDDHICDVCLTEDVTDHKGGKATCIAQAICSECEEPYGDKNAENHTGNTTLVGKKEATYDEAGYTGDEVCECGATVKTGEAIPVLEKENDDTTKPEDNNSNTSGNNTSENNTPATGDSYNPAGWMILMVIALTTIIFISVRKKISNV